MRDLHQRKQRFVEQMAIAISAACCGIALYMALFPAFYYMQWFAVGALAVTTVLSSLGCYFLLLMYWGRRKSEAAQPVQFHGLRFMLSMLAVAVLLVVFKVPLHASFMLAQPGFENALAENQDDLSQVGVRSYDYGLYQVKSATRDCHHKDRIYFRFRDDSESAIIYSESGLDDLCYNSGNKGHLSGNWYWMKED
ncbi:MAG: hypothetical protein P8N09_08235 [Planctomycetota bacterium]|nr:hypothetical protein [Planctomycetota bacterium]